MSKNRLNSVTFKIQRYDPEGNAGVKWQEFMVPLVSGMTILEGLIYIKENLDSSLAFRTSCRMGICGSCAMMVNDYPKLACHTQIGEFHSSKIAVKALPNFPIIKDLVTDLSSLFEKHKTVKPFIIRHDQTEMEQPTAEFAQLPEELDSFEQFSYCVKCGICIAACPTTGSDKRFLGPQALAQCYHYSTDGRDDGSKERFHVVDSDHGVWRCHLAGACSESCPKGVDPALAIQLLKKRLTKGSLGLSTDRRPSQIVLPPKGTQPRVPVPKFDVDKSAGSSPSKDAT
jgi:succinate dehydrogenase / fumarate reductase, iron-sulfur subunit